MWRLRTRSRIARCKVRYNREKVLLLEFGYDLDQTGSSRPFGRHAGSRRAAGTTLMRLRGCKAEKYAAADSISASVIGLESSIINGSGSICGRPPRERDFQRQYRR